MRPRLLCLFLIITFCCSNVFAVEEIPQDILTINNPTILYSLAGNWKFAPTDLSSFSLPETEAEVWTTIPVPGQWHMNSLSSLKTAWYRLPVYFTKELAETQLSIMVPVIADAHEFYVNGIKIGDSGKISDSGTIVKKNSQPGIYLIPKGILGYDKANLLAVRISDDVGWGGFVTSDFYIGEAKLITSKFNRILMWNASIAFVMVFIGIYYLILFIGQPKEKCYLYYFLVTITASATLFGSRSFSYWIVDSFWINHLIFHGGLQLLPIMVYYFTYTFFDFFKGILFQFVTSVYFIFFIFLLLTPFDPFILRIYGNVILTASLILDVFVIGYLFVLVFEAMRQKKLGARSVFAGGLFLFCCGLNDVFSFFGILSFDRLLAEGIIVFALSMSIGMAFKFSKLYEELTRLDKLKDEFLANTSHELRTPLNGIIGISDSLLNGVAGDLSDKVKSNLAMIIASGKRLTNLIADILDYSLLKRENIQLRIKPIDLRGMAEMVLYVTKPLIGSKHLKLINKIPSDFPLVLGDGDRIQQIIFNLIGNAIKFTNEGTIVISANLVGSEVTISVSDTGIGISADKMNQIFQAFGQADSSSTRNYGGIGLGLSISKQLVELHGGSLSIKSELDRGSELTFTLKLSPDQNRANVLPITNGYQVSRTISNKIYVDPQSNTQLATGKIEKKHALANILVVDDDLINLQVISNHLSLENYRVTTVDSAEKALKLIKGEDKPDLVLLDIMMPKTSGYELCHLIRQSKSLWELPIIFLSVKNLAGDLALGFEVGANDYMVKPFSKKELTTRIAFQLQLKNAFGTKREVTSTLQ